MTRSSFSKFLPPAMAFAAVLLAACGGGGGAPSGASGSATYPEITTDGKMT